MQKKPDVTWITPADLTDEQLAEAKQSLHELARTLGRASAEACYKLGIDFDMDDPQVARDVMMATFEALVYSAPPKRRK